MKKKRIKMVKIPLKIKSTVPFREIAKVEDWWNKLNLEDRIELQELYENDQLKDAKTISIQLCGKFVEQERNESNNIFWVNHFYDYIVNHELFIDEYKVEHGGICSRTEAAEKAIKNGIIENQFDCPLKNCNCQMRKILKLNAKKNLKLFIKFSVEEKTINHN